MHLSIEVEMFAFRQGEVRNVAVPYETVKGDLAKVLGETFSWGQNEMQPTFHPSVSMGDVIRYNGERYLIVACGFRLLNEMEYRDYIAMSQEDRLMESLRRKANIW